MPPIKKVPFAWTSTPEERAAGFIETVIFSPQRVNTESESILAVVRIIDDRLMAVKQALPSGGVTYAIMNRDTVRPVRDGVSSLSELRRRYPAQN